MTQALLVIDVQTGTFDGLHCAPMPGGPELIRACQRAIAWARQQALPVIWIQHHEPGGAMDGMGFEIDARLQPLAHEKRVTKRQPSAFEGTALGDNLVALGVTHPVLVGLQSDCCVRATAQAAQARGLNPIVVADAHHTWPNGEHSADAIRSRINQELAQAGIAVLPLADLPTA
ncbi:cysteine hydrolase family protein [Inhella gelatinilytica]|uniref:Isochorismatase family protein n=1 Tax=Inhella gelatinilytica TaxID=2795030 RepID=A0A931NA00_9BURK|nr:isochorismatase family protein [Inhella gelatinilytica]MBH9551928.1 isochorismatase family protein [Inhella gelatinilytica]